MAGASEKKRTANNSRELQIVLFGNGIALIFYLIVRLLVITLFSSPIFINSWLIVIANTAIMWVMYYLVSI